MKQVKVGFALDKESGLPTDLFSYQQREANRFVPTPETWNPYTWNLESLHLKPDISTPETQKGYAYPCMCWPCPYT